jgi:hypothetical protein
MATTTPNFGWPVPTSTDLVKDGATAIEGLGDAIDASLLDLKGGTSGQVLAKNSNTDMDFVWVTDAAGDITGVTAGTGISGGGTSGSVTVSIDTAVTADLSTSQTLTNKTLTSPVLTTPSISNIDAKGDLLAGTADNTIGRLAIGTNGQVLTADSAETTGMKWATAAAGGGWTSLASGSLSGAGLTLSSISGSYKNLRLVIRNAQFSNSTEPGVRIAGVSTNNYSRVAIMNDNNTGVTSGQGATNQVYTTYNTPATDTVGTWIIDFPDYANTTSTKIITSMARYVSAAAGNAAENCWAVGSYNSTAAITEINFRHTVTFNAGTYILYGEN